MTLPTIDGLHYVGCHCNDICACSDPIECIHEQCICNRLSVAYQHGREDERRVVASQPKPNVIISVAHGDLTEADVERLRAAFAAARGDGEQA